MCVHVCVCACECACAYARMHMHIVNIKSRMYKMIFSNLLSYTHQIIILIPPVGHQITADMMMSVQSHTHTHVRTHAHRQSFCSVKPMVITQIHRYSNPSPN